MKAIILRDIDVRFLQVFLPKLRVTEECPEDMVDVVEGIRDYILARLE